MPDARPPVPLAEPVLDGNAAKYVNECLQTNYVSSIGPFVERFEREFASFVGSRFAIACASGTAALHVAMRLLGVSDGDEVFVPTLTFIASANPVLYERGTPVLVDSESSSWNLDAGLVVEEIERRARLGSRLPRVVEVVHLLGRPANIEPIVDVCERHGIAIVEDAAEALGAKYCSGRFAGRQVGTIGRLGCFSFNGNKVITTGGGGMLTTDDEALARRAKHLTTQARLPCQEYRHDEMGFNYRLTNVAAALGVAQLESLPRFLARKRAIADVYDAALTGSAVFERAPRPVWGECSHWLYSMSVRSGGREHRNDVISRLKAGRCEARPVWTPLHLQLPLQDARRLGDMSKAESIFDSALSLPSSVGMTSEQQQSVLSVLDAISRLPP